jgi:hypothetical protein
VWVAHFTWAKNVVGKNGLILVVRCKICSKIENKDKILELPNWIIFLNMLARGKLKWL